MYQAFALFKEIPTGLNEIIGSLADKKGLKKIIERIVRSKNEDYQIVGTRFILSQKQYHFELTLSKNTIQAACMQEIEAYKICMEILIPEADPQMDYFNDFLIFCETLKKEFKCVLLQYNQSDQTIEIM